MDEAEDRRFLYIAAQVFLYVIESCSSRLAFVVDHYCRKSECVRQLALSKVEHHRLRP